MAGGDGGVRSPSTDGFELLTTFGGRARIGVLVRTFTPAPPRASTSAMPWWSICSPARWRASRTCRFRRGNAFAVESAPGVWEIVQAGAAELLAPGRYRLTRLLRGQRGTEGAIGNPALAGARVVVLDASAGVRCRSPRPISDCLGTGASARRAARSATRPMSPRVSRPWALGCGRSRSRMSSSHGAGRARPAILPSAGHGGRGRALGRQLGRGRGATRRRSRGLRGRDPRRRVCEAHADLRGTTSVAYTAAQQTADWGALLGTATRSASALPVLRPRRRGAPKTVTLTL